MSDTIRRVAIQDPMTPDEQALAVHCVESASLYAVLNAAFALAELEGLTLNVDIRRPRKRGAKAKREATK